MILFAIDGRLRIKMDMQLSVASTRIGSLQP
jgi:hypothetical protein